MRPICPQCQSRRVRFTKCYGRRPFKALGFSFFCEGCSAYFSTTERQQFRRYRRSISAIRKPVCGFMRCGGTSSGNGFRKQAKAWFSALIVFGLYSRCNPATRRAWSLSPLAMFERREIIPRDRLRAGEMMTEAPRDRRQLCTDLDFYCRHYQSPESFARHFSRCRLAPLEDVADD